MSRYGNRCLDFSVKAGFRIFSVYRTRTGEKALGHHRSRPKRNDTALAERLLKLKRARKSTNASSAKAPTFNHVHDADASSESDCSRDQKQTCRDRDDSDGSRDALTSRCQSFDGNGYRHDSHRPNVHDPDYQ